jgi:arsenite methyltransferase
MSETAPVDADALRAEVRSKYREVAISPHATYHFHTGRGLAARLGYDGAVVDALPDAAVESFAGVANPFSLRPLVVGERVVDVGVGAGFDAFVAARQVGSTGRVVGVDMTDEMLAIGYFESIDSERGLEWRCADSLSLREFLRLSEREERRITRG